MVYSEQSYQREKKTFDKKLEKHDKELKKALWHLSNDIFACDSDAKKEAAKLVKKFPYHEIKVTINSITKHTKVERPKEGEARELSGYQVQCQWKRNESSIEIFLNRKGRFILATNDFDKKNFPDAKILEEYKEQQNVEKGFRFLKDPWFMVDSVFLKSPHRIEALMMIMTLCLMVYNIGQYRLRAALKEQKETLPNQINKLI